MSSDAVQKKLEELRAEKKAQEEKAHLTALESLQAKEKERQEVITEFTKRLEEGKILWEAEVLLQFESIDVNTIQNGFTADKTIHQYVNELLTKYRFPIPPENKEEELKTQVRNSFIRNPITFKKMLESEYNTLFSKQAKVPIKVIIVTDKHVTEQNNSMGFEVFDFKQDVIEQYIQNTGRGFDAEGNKYLYVGFREIPYKTLYDFRFQIEYKNYKGNLAKKRFLDILHPIDRQRENEKRQKEQEIQSQKDAEKLQRQLKAFQQLEKLATDHCCYTTYKPLKNINYNSNFSVHVLKKVSENSSDWYHYKLDYHGSSQTSGGGYSTEGPVPEMADWFEKGLVPFCMKCPVCNSFTKFNFVTTDRSTPYEQKISKNQNFKEIYCPGHYFFNTRTNTHYVSGGAEILHIQRDNPGNQARLICWEPDELIGRPPLGFGPRIRDTRTRIGWKVWDPSDPDGSKQHEREREKEKQDLQNQIALLQQKLQSV
jgi:hypothetical protein